MIFCANPWIGLSYGINIFSVAVWVFLDEHYFSFSGSKLNYFDFDGKCICKRCSRSTPRSPRSEKVLQVLQELKNDNLRGKYKNFITEN